MNTIKAAADDSYLGRHNHNYARNPRIDCRKISIAHRMSLGYKHEPKELQGHQIACFLWQYHIPQEPLQEFLQGYQPPSPS